MLITACRQSFLCLSCFRSLLVVLDARGKMSPSVCDASPCLTSRKDSHGLITPPVPPRHHRCVRVRRFLTPLLLDSCSASWAKLCFVLSVYAWPAGVSSSTSWEHVLRSCAPLKLRQTRFRDSSCRILAGSCQISVPLQSFLFKSLYIVSLFFFWFNLLS